MRRSAGMRTGERAERRNAGGCGQAQETAKIGISSARERAGISPATPSCAMALGQYMPRTRHFVFDPGLGGLVLVPKVELVHKDASERNPKSHGTHHHWRAQQHLPHSVPNTVTVMDPLSTCSSHVRRSSMSFPRRSILCMSKNTVASGEYFWSALRQATSSSTSGTQAAAAGLVHGLVPLHTAFDHLPARLGAHLCL